MPPRSRRAALGLLLLTASLSAAPAPAPLPPAALEQELRALRTLGTVLHVGAHPDDENTELITWLSRGRHYRAGYLSLTRGDGGQNELGRDFDERLGVLRTQELIAARALDGGHQFFTRAIDFGFSKTPEETLTFWDRDRVLGDVVRIYRQFRPDVVVTRFPIPPGSGGHGHHTASGILALEAFKLAGDPNAYPEQIREGLQPWQPKRILWNVFRFGGNASGPLPLPGPTLTFDIAGKDPVSGEEFGLIAAHSRAMHKTQGLGGFAGRARTGPNEQTFVLLAGDPASADLMDGIDTSWNRLPGGAEIDRLIADAVAGFQRDNPAASVPALLEIHRRLAALPADPYVTEKRAAVARLIQSCLGLQVATRVPTPEIVTGDRVELTVTAQLTADLPVRYVGVRTSNGNHDFSVDLKPNTEARETFTAHLRDTPPSQPYWLREAGSAGLASVSPSTLIGRADNYPVVTVNHRFALGDQEFELRDEAVPAGSGEAGAPVRRVDVIPPVSLALNSEVFYVAPGATKTVTVTATAARAGRGSLSLAAPAGWTVSPATQAFDLPKGASAPFSFTVTAPAAGGAGRLQASATLGDETFSHQRIELRYAHLPVLLLQPPATARVASFELATRGRQVGYLPGAGDYVAECLEQMGYTVRRLTGADLTPEKLAGLDAVVIGVRAFNERDDLKAALPGLLAWVEQGGTVVAQYNRPNGLLAPVLGPAELSIQGPAPQLRVTDETAPVTFLAPDQPALTTPNQITAADFAGWVQERGAYFPSKWDEKAYVSVLALNDPGEAPLRSSLLVAKHGKGRYVYTSLAFFRQLPAGVPGAWRLFANLVSPEQ